MHTCCGGLWEAPRDSGSSRDAARKKIEASAARKSAERMEREAVAARKRAAELEADLADTEALNASDSTPKADT